MKTMQGFNSQALRLQMSLKRQNMMLFDVYTVLQRRQEAADSVLAEATNLQAKFERRLGLESDSSTTCSGSTLNAIDVEQTETATLRITLPRSREVIVLYKGQCVRTPMGEASVLSIIPAVEKVVLRLSFGKMYVTVRQMIVWGREKRLNQLDELLTVDSLRQRWTSLHSTGGLNVPSDIRNAIQDLAGQGDDEPATDGDEDSANDESAALDAIEESNSTLDLKRDCNLAEECCEQSTKPAHVPLEHASSACNGGSIAASLSNVRCATEGGNHWSDCSFPLKGSLSDATSSTSTSTSCSSSSLGASLSSSAAAPLSRQALKNILSLQGMEDCDDDTASSALPYIITPPGNMVIGLLHCFICFVCLTYHHFFDIVSFFLFLFLFLFLVLTACALSVLFCSPMLCPAPALSHLFSLILNDVVPDMYKSSTATGTFFYDDVDFVNIS